MKILKKDELPYAEQDFHGGENYIPLQYADFQG
jgi:hypothetical protein